MNVIVDTSVWSLALRRNIPDEGTSIVNVLRDLIADGRVVLLGAIRQEMLSGIRYTEQFVKLRDYLRQVRSHTRNRTTIHPVIVTMPKSSPLC